jgi:hypothetical protein
MAGPDIELMCSPSSPSVKDAAALDRFRACRASLSSSSGDCSSILSSGICQYIASWILIRTNQECLDPVCQYKLLRKNVSVEQERGQIIPKPL